MHVDGRSAADRGESGRARSAFTLIELLIVILIIGVVVAIVFPALSGARNAARKAATQALMTDLANASSQFYMDHSRQPGYFSNADMASTENLGRGFSAMENIMLDLAGGFTQAATAMGNNNPCDEAAGPQVVEVGPTNASVVRVDIRLIGSSSDNHKRYLTLDAKNFQRQCADGKQVSTEVSHRALPDVVDAWGTPILAWAQNDPGAAQNTSFAERQYTAGGNRARYYWAPNAAFLMSENLGKMSKNQNLSAASGGGYSLLGDPGQSTLDSLAGLLGHPAYPSPSDGTIPAAGRAAIVFHSAGGDGFYLGSDDSGGKRARANGGVVQYNPPAPTAAAGAPIPRQPDPMEAFDDLLVNSGNLE